MKGIILIIGKRSNLSQELHKNINNAFLISSEEILNNNLFENYKNKDITLIFNNFQKSNQLNDISKPSEYLYNSIGITAKILSQIDNKVKIKKIIYTSSASVYGNNNFCKEFDNLSPLSLHASLKISNEKLIEEFCKINHIDYTIVRIFNLYGAKDDSFSIISKLINAIKRKEIIDIINNGSAIRDFIYINDVVKIYKVLINTKNLNIINVGSGYGISIKSILDYLRLNKIHININNITKNEIKISTACIERLNSIVNTECFQNVEEFILNEIIKK